MKKKILSVTLAAAIALTLMPTFSLLVNAGATDARSITIGASGIAAGNHVYYGNYDYLTSTEGDESISWRVLDTKTNAGNDDGIFLLSENVIATGINFKHTEPQNNIWQGSDAQNWCDTFLFSAFDAKEQTAILATTKSDAAVELIHTVNQSVMNYSAVNNILNGDKVFFLSAEEANGKFENDGDRIALYDGTAVAWWMRSPVTDETNNHVGVVSDGGNVSFTLDANNPFAARPAFNLNKDSVLFSSALTAKADAVDSNLAAIADAAPTEWKLTLKDDARSGFGVTESSLSAAQGETKTINYSGAETGENEYVSAMICDNDNNVLYYGRLVNSTLNSGSADITVPSDLTEGEYTLKIFNEQYNGDTQTDISSDFIDIPLTVIQAPVIAVRHAEDGDWTQYHDFAEGWNNAMGASNTVNTQVKLLVDWVADGDGTNNSFGTGTGFKNGMILIPANNRVNLDLNGKSIDRGLSVAIDDGSVIYNAGSLVIVDNSTSVLADQGEITGGNTTDTAGGIFNFNSRMTLSGGKVCGNNAANAGGIYNEVFTIMEMTGGSVSGNTATVEGGGIIITKDSSFSQAEALPITQRAEVPE